MSEESDIDRALNEFPTETNLTLNKEDAGIITAIISEYAIGLIQQGKGLLSVGDARGAKACASQLLRLERIVGGMHEGKYKSDTFDDEVIRERCKETQAANAHIHDTIKNMLGEKGDVDTDPSYDGDVDTVEEPQEKKRLH